MTSCPGIDHPHEQRDKCAEVAIVAEIQQHNRDVLDQVRVRRDALYEAILRLERALSTPAGERIREWSRRVAGALRELKIAFDLHVAITETPGGLFEDVLRQAPRLAHAVDRLRKDHGVLDESLDDAIARVGDLHRHDAVEQFRDSVLDLIRALFEHRHLGAELVYETYDVDLGAGD